MGIRVKEGGGKRWVERAAIAGESYIAGAQNPRQDWETATSKAESNWKAGVNEAASKGRFGKGVKKAGNQAWLNGVINKGADRYATGVALAQEKYETAIAPYIDVMKNLNLKDRGPKGTPGNYDRVKTVGDALHQKKLQLKG